MSKVCEKVALNQLTPYLTSKHGLAATNQCGNRKWHSTETLLLSSTDAILKAIDQRKVTVVVYLDMSKAFDSVNHKTLINKLKASGLSPSAVSWVRSYLSHRAHAVRINSTLADALPVAHGVPQGSVFGALLFNIYVNDLPTVMKSCKS
jgi:retron-type reverse transcriptase